MQHLIEGIEALEVWRIQVMVDSEPGDTWAWSFLASFCGCIHGGNQLGQPPRAGGYNLEETTNTGESRDFSGHRLHGLLRAPVCGRAKHLVHQDGLEAFLLKEQMVSQSFRQHFERDHPTVVRLRLLTIRTANHPSRLLPPSSRPPSDAETDPTA